MLVPAAAYLYSKDIDMEKAEVQLRMLPDLVKAFKQSEGLRMLTISYQHCRYPK